MIQTQLQIKAIDKTIIVIVRILKILTHKIVHEDDIHRYLYLCGWLILTEAKADAVTVMTCKLHS